MPETKFALVVGAGDANGGAVARRFAREGFVTCVTRRHGDKLAPLVRRIEQDGGKAHVFGSDARRDRRRLVQRRWQRAFSDPRNDHADLHQGVGNVRPFRLLCWPGSKSIAENYWTLRCQPRDAWTHGPRRQSSRTGAVGRNRTDQAGVNIGRDGPSPSVLMNVTFTS